LSEAAAWLTPFLELESAISTGLVVRWLDVLGLRLRFRNPKNMRRNRSPA
jgi:hypothetical protein